MLSSNEIIVHHHEICDFNITLDYEQRHIRRKRITSDCGHDVMVDLEKMQILRDGDAFLLNDGRKLNVIAARESLLKITHDYLPVIAWHIGNRHTPCQYVGDDAQAYLLIKYDQILRDMLINLEASVDEITAPFHPESGAYAHHH